MQDSVLAMFGINFKMADESIMETKVYGAMDGKTVFYSRAHQMKLQMERDYGIYKQTAIKKEVLLHDDRYARACESIGYKFDPNGLSIEMPDNLDSRFFEPIESLLSEKYETTGRLISAGDKTNAMLSLESFKYYLQMPAYIYPNNQHVVKWGFMTFVMNSIIVIGFAMIAQVILCSISAFVISRMLSPKAGRFVLLFFLGGMIGSVCEHYDSAAYHVSRDGGVQ